MSAVKSVNALTPPNIDTEFQIDIECFMFANIGLDFSWSKTSSR